MRKRGDPPGGPKASRRAAAPEAPRIDAARQRALAEVLALHERGALAATIPLYRTLLAADSRDARLWLNLGAAFQGLGQRDAALTAYQEANLRDPSLVEAAFNLGCVLAELGRDEEAARAFAAAVRLRPSFAGAHYTLGNTLRRLGKPEASVASYREAIRLRASHADAEAAFLNALSHNPDHGAAFANLATVHRFTRNDPLLDQVHAIEARRAALPLRTRIEISYGLGKIYDDLDDPGTAMARLAEGAPLIRAQLIDDEAGEAALLANLKSALTSEVLSRAREGCPSPPPVFVVGMPRSGTTLVEQILASHPSVAGAGELKALGRCLEGWIGPEGVDLKAGGRRAIAATRISPRSRPGLAPRFCAWSTRCPTIFAMLDQST